MTAPARPRLTTVPEPVVLDASDPERTLAFLAWLRDTHTELTGVSWQAIVGAGVDTTLLHHLPPPDRTVGGPTAPVEHWQAAHRPAQCYYRIGPGFIQVKDVRRAEDRVRLLLDEPALVNAFLRCLTPTRIDDLDPAERAATQELSTERLVLRLGDWVVVLPYRMRRWPVPSQFA